MLRAHRADRGGAESEPQCDVDAVQWGRQAGRGQRVTGGEGYDKEAAGSHPYKQEPRNSKIAGKIGTQAFH